MQGQILLPAVQAWQKTKYMGMYWNSPNSSFDPQAQVAVMHKFDFCKKDLFLQPSKQKVNETDWL